MNTCIACVAIDMLVLTLYWRETVTELIVELSGMSAVSNAGNPKYAEISAFLPGAAVAY
ncbi:MAG: hypothetical protein UY97_C0017G0002 [Parcubacteria group bacterium GW2011_GWB1_57_6]|nr:MAG: hypothetical protein UY93_C0002G0418 [Parcubacteria group bacterium GW2011_GWA1_56_13]KKW45672.1 MAG: hypothetical protein UY97_C0017G0002 [Parcubacteria group bacterium GW2011_GWB1_57_6]